MSAVDILKDFFEKKQRKIGRLVELRDHLIGLRCNYSFLKSIKIEGNQKFEESKS